MAVRPRLALLALLVLSLVLEPEPIYTVTRAGDEVLIYDDVEDE
jgi:hypothetical protein